MIQTILFNFIAFTRTSTECYKFSSAITSPDSCVVTFLHMQLLHKHILHNVYQLQVHRVLFSLYFASHSVCQWWSNQTTKNLRHKGKRKMVVLIWRYGCVSTVSSVFNVQQQISSASKCLLPCENTWLWFSQSFRKDFFIWDYKNRVKMNVVNFGNKKR